jgi:fumarylpyruvate hydrolase
MSAYVFEPVITAVPVEGGAQFAVRRIFCVGRNYPEHAREMGHDPNAEPPFFFMKPADALVTSGRDTPYPPATNDLHHEIELVAAVGTAGTDIDPANALAHLFGYAVGIDFTRRDLQAAAKKAARPWDMAKGFDNSAPISTLVPAARIGHPSAGRIELRVNDETRQEGDIGLMSWDVPHILAHLSRLVELRPGDLVFTGTPAGVGPVRRGDRLEGSVAGVGAVQTTIV